MNHSLKSFLHYLALVGVIVLGASLRFWHLDLKPLWLDEVITALFSLGHSYNDVPLEAAFPVSTLEPIFTLKRSVSCDQIAQTLATQSTHPPLFFCWMHSWLTWVDSFAQSWVWKLRSLPAVIGVAAIVAAYWLNRVAFSPAAGLMGAAVMAVSPFGVYLSQEARHYTLPVLLITLALLGLIQLQKDLYFRQQMKPCVWLGWVIVNSVGFWVHYFFILTFIAQISALTLLFYKARYQIKFSAIFSSFTFCLMPIAFFIPWLPVILSHSGSSETSWLPHPHNVAPLYQTLAGWLLMVIALPVENQPLWITIPAGVLMLVFGGLLVSPFLRGLEQLVSSPKTQVAVCTLVTFILCMLLQFLVIVYLLGKDVTIAPRYNFVYFPAICALLGASLTVPLSFKRTKFKKSRFSFVNSKFLVIGVGLISCLFVASNWAFRKPFNPQEVAQNMNINASVPLMVVVGYSSYQDIALGLSFALALDQIKPSPTSPLVACQSKFEGCIGTMSQQLPRRIRSGHGDTPPAHQDNFGKLLASEYTPGSESVYFAFLNNSAGYQAVWQQVQQLKIPKEGSLNLWVVAPGLKRVDYPPQLTLMNYSRCTLDATQHYRLGIPYQLYRCQ